MMALGIGLAVNNSRAALEGLFGRDVEFVRTPNAGLIGASKTKRANVYRGGQWPWHSLLEIGFGLYCGATLFLAVVTKSWLSIPFVLLFCIGFLYVGTAGLLEALRDRWAQGAGAPESATQLPSSHSSPSAVWAKADADERSRWQRDQALLRVASSAREARFRKALGQVGLGVEQE